MTRLVVPAFLLLLAAKVAVALRLDLFGDEAFYWQCAQHPALAYADHPFMTAMTVRAGTVLFGDSPLGVRAFFLVLGACVPFVVYAIARPLAGRRDALLAAGAALILPGTAYLGVIAIPDVPLVLFSALALLGLERATRTGRIGWWVLCGAAGALGFCTHLRFALVPLGAGLYLLCTRAGRKHLRTPGPWIAVLLLLAGLLPVIAHNWRLEFAPLRYSLADRHEAGADPMRALRHLPEQAAVVTPFLYVALLAVLVRLVRDARQGSDRAALLAAMSLATLGTYLVASPFSDADHATVHWPVFGYVPLLAFLPDTLRRFVARPAAPRARARRRRVAALVPGFSGVVLLFLFVEAGTGLFGVEPLYRPFAGWREPRAVAGAMVDRFATRLVVADDYILAGNLDLALHDEADVYVLDSEHGRQHGRGTQYDLWQRGETALRERSGARALVVVDWERIRFARQAEWLEHVRSFVAPLEPLGEVRAADRVFAFYLGTVR